MFVRYIGADGGEEALVKEVRISLDVCTRLHLGSTHHQTCAARHPTPDPQVHQGFIDCINAACSPPALSRL